MSNNRLWWCLEGIDGCGKSSILNRVVSRLTDQGISIFAHAEPGGSELGLNQKEMLCSADLPGLSKMCFFIGLMIYHWLTKVQPALTAGNFVICDRYYPSTLVYQGREAWPEYLYIISNLIDKVLLEIVSPPKIILIDIGPEVAINRLRDRRTHSIEYYDQRIETLRNLRAAYLKLAHEREWYIVNGEAPIEDVDAEVSNIIMSDITQLA